eukprot:gnl/MRDRNA2_/MRDRNA2_182728_c0_seq1.p1 gnl/MRDRNA2_/MRDRNA2_182728_c0~~gnl/MRDRNA2_/MRDRNA2_182728_c0_seq1.p1  ORF type:complete len:390 (-),score=51.32 gnl/MRDRNA2_/MRDRNA2_182728_c0_seq1:84-1253(-)
MPENQNLRCNAKMTPEELAAAIPVMIRALGPEAIVASKTEGQHLCAQCNAKMELGAFTGSSGEGQWFCGHCWLAWDPAVIIQKFYVPRARHQELMSADGNFRDGWLSEPFVRAHSEGAWDEILWEVLPGLVYEFSLFSETFCDLLVDELMNYYDSGMPVRTPNSMNRYGLPVRDLGVEPLMGRLQQLLQPLGQLLFPGPGDHWDGYHAFVVRYREGEDVSLDMHTDDSDVTFNVCLGRRFKGGALSFCGLLGAGNHRHFSTRYNHVKGRCVVHLGRHRHGAEEISQGERLNLIIWNGSRAWRAANPFENIKYEKEDGPPDPVCVSALHDRDFGMFKAYTEDQMRHRNSGSFPYENCAYTGFVPDRGQDFSHPALIGRLKECTHTWEVVN